MMRQRKLFVVLCAVLGLASAAAVHAAGTASQASAQSSAAVSAAAGAVVGGSVAALSAGATLSVVAVEQGSEATVLTLKNLSTGAEVVLRVSGQMAGGLSVAVGTTVQVLGEGAGYLLTSAGKALAFVPNEVGQSLLQHTRLTGAAS